MIRTFQLVAAFGTVVAMGGCGVVATGAALTSATLSVATTTAGLATSAGSVAVSGVQTVASAGARAITPSKPAVQPYPVPNQAAPAHVQPAYSGTGYIR